MSITKDQFYWHSALYCVNCSYPDDIILENESNRITLPSSSIDRKLGTKGCKNKSEH